MRPTKNVAMSGLLTECHFRIFCLLNFGFSWDKDRARNLLARLEPHMKAFLTSKPKRRKAVRK